MFSVFGFLVCLEEDLGLICKRIWRHISPTIFQILLDKRCEIKVGIWKHILVEQKELTGGTITIEHVQEGVVF